MSCRRSACTSYVYTTYGSTQYVVNILIVVNPGSTLGQVDPARKILSGTNYINNDNIGYNSVYSYEDILRRYRSILCALYAVQYT